LNELFSITKKASGSCFVDKNARLVSGNKHLVNENDKNGRIVALLQQVDFESLSPKRAFDLLWECKDL
jgi:hypothetical protein